MRRFIFGLLGTSLLFTPSAHADSISKERKVREMLSAMHIPEATDRLERAQEERLDALAKQQLAGATLDADQKKAYDTYREKAVTLLRESASWKALEPDFIKLYSNAYSEEEIDGILAFYRTPVGRTMLAKMPELTEQTIALSQSRMAELAPKIQVLVEELQRNTM